MLKHEHVASQSRTIGGHHISIQSIDFKITIINDKWIKMLIKWILEITHFDWLRHDFWEHRTCSRKLAFCALCSCKAPFSDFPMYSIIYLCHTTHFCILGNQGVNFDGEINNRNAFCWQRKTREPNHTCHLAIYN